mgnify:CR=1 FL=1
MKEDKNFNLLDFQTQDASKYELVDQYFSGKPLTQQQASNVAGAAVKTAAQNPQLVK